MATNATTDTPVTPGEDTDTAAATLPANETPATETPATETPTTENTDTAATPPATDTQPKFVFPGVPRRYWGELCKAAEKADKEAAEAEADADETETRHHACLAALSNAAETEAAAEDAAAVAKGRAKVAADAAERATSTEELHERRRKADEAAEAAFEAEKNAAAVKAQIEAKRRSGDLLLKEVERKREKARQLRDAADKARRRAEEYEVPRLLEQLAKQAEVERMALEAGALRAARRNLPRVNCRDCRFWEPWSFDPRRGGCHARPPEIDRNENAVWATVSPGDWCAVGETIPAAVEADTPATVDADA